MARRILAGDALLLVGIPCFPHLTHSFICANARAKTFFRHDFRPKRERARSGAFIHLRLGQRRLAAASRVGSKELTPASRSCYIGQVMVH